MITAANRKNRNNFELIDNSYPSERTMLEVDVFRLETLIGDYLSRREADDYGFAEFDCDEWDYDCEENERYSAASSDLIAKRARLAALAQ